MHSRLDDVSDAVVCHGPRSVNSYSSRPDTLYADITQRVDEHNYQNASSFIPERWYSRPGMIKHKDAYAPFSMGPMGCIGKNLALTELRTLTARLVTGFDVKFAKGEDGKRIMTETLDHFTVDPGDLELVFTKV